ncbi:hypothetical protein H6G45_15070 [Synechocystis sp. FACHB-383]|nr:hypothetical protein [Synechocystis sp. FACHB-383]MBD2654780.1 hypothetical protein [Synechocystis sp. FACHB-383]
MVNSFTPNATVDDALIRNYQEMADTINFTLEDMAKTKNIPLDENTRRTYTERIIAFLRYLLKFRHQLCNSPSFRKRLMDNYLMPMFKRHGMDILGMGLMFGLAVTCVPELSSLLLAKGLVGLTQFALPYIHKFVVYLANRHQRLAKLFHWLVGGIRQCLDRIQKILVQLWKFVETMAHQGWQGTVNVVGKTITAVKDCLVSLFNWGWDKVKSLFGSPQAQLNPT